MTYEIGIIGGGNMGAAIARGVIEQSIVPASQIIVAEVDADKRRDLSKLNCAATESARDATDAQAIILAVKPQSFPGVARSIAPLSGPSRVVISIMAGLHSAKIRAALGTSARVVRAMPNVACQIGAGMTAVAHGDGAQPGDEQTALRIFNALGRTIMVDESLMYAATAVSASGLAYIFFIAEAMEQAAIELGFDSTSARLAVTQTILGAGRLLTEIDQSPAALRESVTSRGGTTEAALAVMGQRGLRSIISAALKAARDRGIELDRS